MSTTTTTSPAEPSTLTEIKSITSYPSSPTPTPFLPSPYYGSPNRSYHSALFIIAIIGLALVIAVTAFIAWRCIRNRREASRSRHYLVNGTLSPLVRGPQQQVPLQQQQGPPQQGQPQQLNAQQPGPPPLVLSELHGHYAPPAPQVDPRAVAELRGHYAPPAVMAPQGDVPVKQTGSPALYG